MTSVKEQEIIRLWNQLRLLEREGRPTTAVRRQIEKALEHGVEFGRSELIAPATG